jgi:HEAT repeat protein
MSKLPALGLALALVGGLIADEGPAKEPLLAGKPIAHWIGELKLDDPLVREEAIEVLADAGPAAKSARPALEKLLADPDSSIRARAALALWKIAGPSEPVTRALIDNLPSANLSVRLQALTALAQMGKDAGDVAGVILELLDDPDGTVRSFASATLAKLGPAAVPTLAKNLSHKDVSRRRHAAAQLLGLAHRAREVRPALRAALEDEDLQVRVDVARTLWFLDDRDEAVINTLAEGVARGDPAVQTHVLALATNTARSQPRDQARKLLPIIEAGLKVKDLGRRVLAAQALYLLQGDKAKVLPIYLEALQSPSSGVWVPAVRALADLGPDAKPALPRLIELLKKNTPYSFDLGTTLGNIGKPAAAPVARALCDDPKNYRLQNVARKTFQVIGPAALPEVLPLLKHKDTQVRTVAASALQLLGPAAEPAVPDLIAFLDNPDLNLRRTAVSTLQRIGPGAKKAVPVLVKLAGESRDLSLKTTALRAIADIHPQAKEVVPLAEELLKQPSPSIRLAGLEALAKHDPEHPDLLPKARELLKDPRLRQGVVSLLGRVGAPAARFVPDLVELLKDPKPSVRSQVLYALGKIGPGARPAVPALLKAIQDEKADRNLRQGGLYALKQIGGDARDVVPVLGEMLQEKSNYENRLIADLLAGYGPEARAAGPRLATVARAVASNPYEQFSVLEALIRVDPERAKKDAVPLLRPQLSSPYAPDAARLLLLIDPEDREARKAVEESLKSTSRTVRQRAVAAAGSLGEKGKGFLPEVEKALEDPSPYVRIVAAYSRWQITGQTKTSVDVLLEVLQDKKTQRARSFAARQLGEMGAAAEQALPTLKKAAQRHPDPRARSAARYAVSRIEDALKAKKKS